MAGHQRRVVGGRQELVKVKLTTGQREALQARAAELGVSVPRLMVDSALTPAGLTLPEQRALWTELEGLARLLSALGNNVNQIARALNSGGAMRPGEIAGAAEAVERVAGRLDGMLDALPTPPRRAAS